MTALGVISLKKINHDCVLFILFRDMVIPHDIANKFSIVNMPNEIIKYDYFHINKLHKFRWYKIKKIIFQLDNFLSDNLSNYKFQFYCQNSRHYYLNMISTHPNCIDTFFIEESMDAHLSRDLYNSKYSFELKWPYKIINAFCAIVFSKLTSRRIILPKSPFEKRTKERVYFYGLTNDSFLSYVSEEFIKTVNVVLLPELEVKSSKIFVIALSALQEQNVLDANSSSIIYKEFIEKEKIKDDIYLKFHPFQSEHSKKIFVNSLNKFNIKILSDDFILEKEFLSGNIYLISIASSLLVYANKLNINNKVKPLYKFAKNKVSNERFNIWDDALNKIVTDEF